MPLHFNLTQTQTTRKAAKLWNHQMSYTYIMDKNEKITVCFKLNIGFPWYYYYLLWCLYFQTKTGSFVHDTDPDITTAWPKTATQHVPHLRGRETGNVPVLQTYFTQWGPQNDKTGG